MSMCTACSADWRASALALAVTRSLPAAASRRRKSRNQITRPISSTSTPGRPPTPRNSAPAQVRAARLDRLQPAAVGSFLASVISKGRRRLPSGGRSTRSPFVGGVVGFPAQQVAWLAVERFAECGEGGEAHRLGAAVLEDGQVGGGDPDAVGEFA